MRNFERLMSCWDRLEDEVMINSGIMNCRHKNIFKSCQNSTRMAAHQYF